MIHVGRGRTDDGVLSARLCRERRGGLGTQNRLGCVGAASEDDVLHFWGLGEFLKGVALGDDHLQGLFRHPCIPESFGEEPGHGCSHRGGLQNNGIAGCQSGHDTAAGNGAGEVPRRDDQHGALGLDIYIGHGIEFLHRRGVEPAIVYTFRYLHVALDDGLASDGAHGTDQVATQVTHAVGRVVHDLVALLYRRLAPVAGIGGGYLHDFLHLGSIGLRHLADLYFLVLRAVVVFVAAVVHHRLGTDLCGDNIRLVSGALLPLLEDVALPLLVAFPVEVCVLLVDHLVLRRHGGVRLTAVLCAVRCVVQIVLDGIGVLELLAQKFPGFRARLEVERVGEEIVGSRILVHAAYKVRHGVEEFLVVDHWGIENHVVAEFRLGTPNMVGHALEHLEAEGLFGRLVFLGEKIGVGDGVEVVGGHTDVQAFCILGQQSALDDVQVVGVDFCLVGTHGGRPSVERRGDSLHVEVATFHDTHFDGCSTTRAAFLGKVEQAALEIPGVGKIGLHHDAGRIMQKLWLGECGQKHLDRHVEVLVFLHVEVDKLRALLAILVDIGIVDGRLIECRHASYQFGKRLLVVQRVGLGVDAGDFHGDIVDVGLLQRVYRVLVAAVGFFVAEHDFAKQVHVLSDLLLVALSQMTGQIGARGIENDARGVHAQTLFDDGYGDGVEEIAKRLVHLEEPRISLVEELGHSVFVDEHLDALGQLTFVADLRALVEHLHEKLLVAGTFYHSGIHILLTAFSRRNTILAGVVEGHQP